MTYHPLEPNPYASQATWYIDHTNGNDLNNGISPGTAIKTITEYVHRVGNTPLTGTTVLNILSSQPLDSESAQLRPILMGDAMFVVRGVPALHANITLGTVTAKNKSTATKLQSTGFTGCTPGQLVVNHTKDGYAFIDSMAGDTATFTQPLAPFDLGTDTLFITAPTFPAQIDTWTTGDAVSVYDLPAINLQVFSGSGGFSDSNNNSGNAIVLDRVHVLDGTGLPGFSYFSPVFSSGGYVHFMNSWIDPFLSMTPESSVANLINCWINGGMASSAGITVILAGAINTFGANIRNESLMDCECYLNSVAAVQGALTFGKVGVFSDVFIESAIGFMVDVVWGNGSIQLNVGGIFARYVGGTWASLLLISNLRLPSSSTTGTAYAAGSWLDGISLSAANLDTYHGLQDPRTGARFCENV